EFERFIKVINERGKGVLQINYLGGAPKTMDTFQVGNNTKSGIVDIASMTGAYYTNVLPEADALKLIELPVAEFRKTPGFEYIQKLHNEKMNVFYLGKLYETHTFRIYLNKEINKADFTGLKIRVTPIYRSLVEALGGTAITSPPPEVYTMLERNTVDGYGWPLHGIFDFSWQKVTKYRLEHAFYSPDIQFLVNLSVWNKLNAAQKKLLQDTVAEFEKDNAANANTKKMIDDEKAKQAAAGIKEIVLPPAEAAKFQKAAYDAGWAGVIKASPQHGAKLKELLSKK
ncbi:MAG: TRAP transporter substrate-binding protein DctP, partial [Alphaproteobacteria bacterium]